MKRMFSRVVVLVCMIASASAFAAEQMAAVEQLKAEAFRALKDGHFDQTNRLLGEAAKLSGDPALSRMSQWINEFETQRMTFASQRHEEYQKAVANVQKLIDHGKDEYALEPAARAYMLADNKKAFRDEKWVDDLLKQNAALAAKNEAAGQWAKSLRLYSELGMIEPANPLWKEKLKGTTRRLRLLALYAPENLKAIQETEVKAREEVDALLKPTTKPTTKPVEPDEKTDFKLDWREALRGVRFDMLWDALVDARTNYYRETTYKQLMNGGVNGLKAVVTTKGLSKTFPNLEDANKKAEFIDALDAATEMANIATPATEQNVLREGLVRLKAINDRTVQLPEEVFVNEFADGALAELDPFTNMIWPNDLDEFRKTVDGEFSGVGVQIQSDDDGSLRVVSPLEDTPAYKAGIKAGDIISKINGKSAKGITVNQAVKQITGPSGTTVVLTVRSPDMTVKEYTIRRETIKVLSVKGYQHRPGGGWDYFVDPDQKVAYLRLTNFTKETSKELAKAVDEIKAAGGRGLILDLRYNPGGLLQAAAEVGDKFLTEGVIVSTHADRDTPNQPTALRAGKDDDDSDLPLVVLVNQYSASASEIVSGALKDLHRAILVGERTFGKGSVQMMFPLGGRSACLKLTTSHYYLPSGRCIHREENSMDWGVDPDVKVEMTPEQMRAAIDARQDMDVLRDANAKAETPSTQPTAEKKEKKDLLTCDPQLSAALLMLRLQLSGAPLQDLGKPQAASR